MSELRKYKRIETDALLDYTGKDVLLYHCIKNLSLGGICINTPDIEEIGSEVILLINFPDLGKSVEVKGVVVWANHEPPKDMGIRFVDLAEEGKDVLKTYLSLKEERKQK